MATLEKAKEHYQTTKDKHKKEMDSLAAIVDAQL